VIGKIFFGNRKSGSEETTMGNGNSARDDSQEFLNASKRFSDSELRDLKKLFVSLAYQSRSQGEYIIASVFQAHFGIRGALGGRLFDLVTRNRETKSLYYEDLVIAKALYEKGAPDETESFMYQLVDLTGDGQVQRTEVEGVILSILQTVLGSKDSVLDSSLPENSLEAFLQSASFTEEGGGEGEAAAACMSMQDFRKWCASTPSVKRFLTTLLKGPISGVPGRQVPELLTPDNMSQSGYIMRKEYAWHIAGGMQAEETVEWVLVYHSPAQGLSFNTFLGKLAAVQGPSVLIIKDKEGCVYGGYASQPWEKHSDFYGDMKSFLFSAHPKAAVHRPTGKNANLQWCAVNYTSPSIPNGIGFGGQIHHFGVFIDGFFERGHTRHSVTFNNPPLSSNPDIVPDVIECWAVVVKGDTNSGTNGASALQGTVLERFKEDRQMLNMVGIAGASDS